MSGGVITLCFTLLWGFGLWFSLFLWFGLLAPLAPLFLRLGFGLWFSLPLSLFLCFFALGYLTKGEFALAHGANVEEHARVEVFGHKGKVRGARYVYDIYLIFERIILFGQSCRPHFERLIVLYVKPRCQKFRDTRGLQHAKFGPVCDLGKFTIQYEGVGNL